MQITSSRNSNTHLPTIAAWRNT